MKREILFRGKRTDNGEWAEGFWAVLPTDEGEPEYTVIEPIDDEICLWHRPPVDPETVGQYTGLTDRNGKRIFEGDIVEYVRVGWDDPEMTRAEVIWCDFDGGWGSTEGQDYWPDALTATDAERMTVIGNIHDNQELLNHETTTRNGG